MGVDRGLLVGVALVLEGWALMLAAYLIGRVLVTNWTAGNPILEGLKVLAGLAALAGALGGWYLSVRAAVIRIKLSGARPRD